MRKMMFILLCLLLGFACLNALAEDVNELRFPDALVEIGQEAFMGDASIERVVLHEGIQRIGPRAFAFTSATEVYLPISLSSIADDAFEGCESVHLYVYSDSYAHQWCTQHTIPYTVLDAADAPSDSTEERTLDFGNAGYAILAENVIQISNPVSALGGGRYALTTSTSLTVGDVVYMSVNGQWDMYKISSVTQNADGTVTITEDPDIYLDEMYEAIYLDTYLASGKNIAREAVNETLTVIDNTFGIQVGLAELSADLSLKIRLKFIYDPKFLGKDQVDVEVYTEYAANCGVFVGADIDTWETGTPLAFPIYSGLVMIPGINLPCQLTVSIPCHAAITAGSRASIAHFNRSGFKYTTDNGYEKIDSNDSYATAELTGAVELAIGPEISLGLSLFKDTFTAKIGGQVGVKISGELISPSYGGSTAELEDSIHACASCVDIEASIFGKMRGNCGMKLFKELSIKPADITICEGEIALGIGHCSIINDKESIYGGNLHFEWTECKNKKYLTTVRTLDIEGTEINGLPVTITGEKTFPLSATSPAYTYLYSGDYEASAAFDSGICSEPFVVQDRATNVTLKEEALVIKGVVTSSDGGKALSNASVTLTLPDGSTRSATTNALGEYEFDELRAGTYSLYFSAPDHQSRMIENFSCMTGTTNGVNVELPLEVEETVIKGTVRSSDSRNALENATVTLTLPDGSTRSTKTDSRGYFEFTKLPGGVFSITFVATGHQSQTMNDLEYAAGSINAVSVELTPNFPERNMGIPDNQCGDFIYTLWDNGTAEITDYVGGGGAVIIPTELDGIPVYDIDDYAFRGNSKITSLVVPGCVKDIGAYAFAYCYSLTSVTLEQGVERVGVSGFTSCRALIRVMLPESLTFLGENAFSYCESLQSITLPNSLTTLGGYIFRDCKKLLRVTLPAHLTSIPGYAFANCYALTSLTIPDGVVNIGSYAFYGCKSLTGITIPDSVKRIDIYAFSWCEMLSNVVLGNGVEEIAGAAFSYCNALRSIILPSSVTTLGPSVFQKSEALQEVILPDTITCLNNDLFWGCTSLVKVNIPQCTTKIGDRVFYQCSALKEIVVPDNVKSIGNSAYAQCTSLEIVVLPDKLESIGTEAFINCTSLSTLTLPNSIISIGEKAFYASGLASINVPRNLTVISKQTFSNCDALVQIEIPTSVMTISSYAFADCDGLKSIVCQPGLVSIEGYAFSDCIALESVSLPEGILQLNNGVFKNCEALRQITLPNSLTSIGESTFRGSGLISITIPDSVMILGKDAFRYCESLISVSLSNSIAKLEDGTFYGCIALTDVNIPSSVIQIGYEVFVNCKSLTELMIPETVTTIKCSFRSLPNLTLIVTPGSVAEAQAIKDGVPYRTP